MCEGGSVDSGQRKPSFRGDAPGGLVPELPGVVVLDFSETARFCGGEKIAKEALRPVLFQLCPRIKSFEAETTGPTSEANPIHVYTSKQAVPHGGPDCGHRRSDRTALLAGRAQTARRHHQDGLDQNHRSISVDNPVGGISPALNVVKGMSNRRQIANERNAKKSTGPKTEAGKARSRLNALKHGAYAEVCLEGEDRTRYKTLVLDLLAQYNPVGFEEKLIVQEIADTIWRKNRFKAAEALTLRSYMFLENGQAAEKGDVGYAMAQDASAYSTIPRCLATENLLDRRLWFLFDRLRKKQKKRGVDSSKSHANAVFHPSLLIERGVQVSEPQLETADGHKSSGTNESGVNNGEEPTV